MEEKLKSFGDLLKETLGNRAGGEEVTPIEEGSTQMSDEDRKAIFSKLAQVAPKEDKPAVSRETSVNEGAADSFGSLLEQAIHAHAEVDKEDTEVASEIREAIVDKSRIDFTEEMMKRLLG